MNEIELLEGASERVLMAWQIIQTEPKLNSRQIAARLEISPSTLWLEFKNNGVKIKQLRALAANGIVHNPDVEASKPPGKPIIVPEWLTRPLRSYRHISIQYHNGVPA